MLYKLNKMLEKFMPIMIPVSVVIGVLLSVYIKDFSFLIPWIFAFMTFSGSLNSNFVSMKQAVMNPLPILLVIFILHIFMPLWALGVGHLAFSGDSFTITGLVLAMAIPTGITSFVWVSIYKGNTALTLAIILIDTMLSPFVVPLIMSLLVGGNIEMDIIGMTQGLLMMIVIPSIVGMTLNQVLKGKVVSNLSARLSPFAKIAMGLVVMLNGAVVAPYFLDVNLKLIGIAIIVFFIALSGYLISFFAGKLFKQDKETIIALMFSGGMRNISAGAVLAVSYFPPAVAVPVVLGMLFQQTLASIYGFAINRYYLKQKVV
jgi:predicted Na+-dependent transporter